MVVAVEVPQAAILDEWDVDVHSRRGRHRRQHNKEIDARFSRTLNSEFSPFGSALQNFTNGNTIRFYGNDSRYTIIVFPPVNVKMYCYSYNSSRLMLIKPDRDQDDVCLPTCSSVRLPVYMSVCLFVCLSKYHLLLSVEERFGRLAFARGGDA